MRRAGCEWDVPAAGGAAAGPRRAPRVPLRSAPAPPPTRAPPAPRSYGVRPPTHEGAPGQIWVVDAFRHVLEAPLDSSEVRVAGGGRRGGNRCNATGKMQHEAPCSGKQRRG
jgi:hypothetical protein